MKLTRHNLIKKAFCGAIKAKAIAKGQELMLFYTNYHPIYCQSEMFVIATVYIQLTFVISINSRIKKRSSLFHPFKH